MKAFGLGITSYHWLSYLEKHYRAGADLQLLSSLPEEHAGRLLKALPHSKAQLRQDIFVLSKSNFKRGGFFVEFGAAGGVEFSNSYLLEKEYGWNGILAEPSRHWHQQLRHNRSCAIETNCVWRATGEQLAFNEVAKGALSTIDSFSKIDFHARQRWSKRIYLVNTISLNDLMDKYNAPAVVDYLSIDTEGSELMILASYDFKKRPIRIITVEHNFTPQRQEIYKLLTAAGYRREHEAESSFDDWYILSSETEATLA